MAEVYRNLRTDTWSLREGGRVVDHPEVVCLTDVRFVVQPAGRERVRREGRKNVHAFVRGNVVDSFEYWWNPIYNYRFRRATYNPYQHDTFVDSLTGEPVLTSAFARLDEDFNVYYVTDEER